MWRWPWRSWRPSACWICWAAPRRSAPGRWAESQVALALEELEAIRLLDLLGCTQEECAEQMGVARSTVQQVYDAARRKLALALVEGRELVVAVPPCGGVRRPGLRPAGLPTGALRLRNLPSAHSI